MYDFMAIGTAERLIHLRLLVLHVCSAIGTERAGILHVLLAIRALLHRLEKKGEKAGRTRGRSSDDEDEDPNQENDNPESNADDGKDFSDFGLGIILIGLRGKDDAQDAKKKSA